MTSAKRPVFPMSRPVGPDDLVDREAFLDDLVNRLAGGQNLVIAGPRKVGKSGVAQAALRRLKAQGIHVASVDLYPCTSVDELATQWTQSVLENRTGPLAGAQQSIRSLWEKLRQLQLTVKIHDLEFGARLLDEDQTPYDQVDGAGRLLEEMAKHDHTRAVVVLDEFQRVGELGGEALTARLRSLIQGQSLVAYLFLGSEPSKLLKLFADRKAPLYRLAVPERLPPIPPTAWLAYLTKKFGDAGVTMTDGAFSLLMERSEGHPWALMQLAFQTWALRQTDEEVSADDVVAATLSTLERLHSEFVETWEGIRRIRAADLVLEHVVAGRSPYVGSTSHRTIAAALRALVDQGYLEKGMARGQYRVVDPLFRDWIRRLHGVELAPRQIASTTARADLAVRSRRQTKDGSEVGRRE